jgi:ribosomal protein L11
MSKEIVKQVLLLIKGGMVTTGPPLGPACGRFVKNLKELVSEINDKTSLYKGYKIKIRILVFSDKSYDFSIYSVPISTELVMLKKDKQILNSDLLKLANRKFGLTDSKSVESYYKEIVGTVNSHKLKIIYDDDKK